MHIEVLIRGRTIREEKENWRNVEAFIIREASGSRDLYGIINTRTSSHTILHHALCRSDIRVILAIKACMANKKKSGMIFLCSF
jgi:hypothetical protein